MHGELAHMANGVWQTDYGDLAYGELVYGKRLYSLPSILFKNMQIWYFVFYVIITKNMSTNFTPGCLQVTQYG